MIVDQHLDYDVINALKEVMEEDFTFLIETYFQDSSNRITGLRTAVSAKDTDAIRRAAHSMKGSCSNLGALRLASLCSALEIHAMSASVEMLERDINTIADEFAIVKKLLQEFIQ